MIEKNLNLNDIYKLLILYKDNYHPNISYFRHIYAYRDKKLVSFVIFDIIYERCEIIDIFTIDNYRKKGIASQLINEIIKDFNIENITLEVKSDNLNAINLYESLGFKKVSIRRGYYNGIDAILMIKKIG